jgi:protein subunit release factor B
MKFTQTKDDFEYQWFSGTGAGGQNRNKNQNCFRIKHKATGIIKTGQSHKSREANKKEALQAMVADPKFRAYCEMKLVELEKGKTLEQEVDEWMAPENLQVQVKDENGKWVDEARIY